MQHHFFDRALMHAMLFLQDYRVYVYTSDLRGGPISPTTSCSGISSLLLSNLLGSLLAHFVCLSLSGDGCKRLHRAAWRQRAYRFDQDGQQCQ